MLGIPVEVTAAGGGGTVAVVAHVGDVAQQPLASVSPPTPVVVYHLGAEADGEKCDLLRGGRVRHVTGVVVGVVEIRDRMRGYQVAIGVPGDGIRTTAGLDRGTVARHRRGDGLGGIGVGRLGITTPGAAIATHTLLFAETAQVGRRGMVQRALLRRCVLIGVGRGAGPPVVLIGCHVGRVGRAVGEQHDDPHGNVRFTVLHQFGRRLAQSSTDVGVDPAEVGHQPLGIRGGHGPLRTDVDLQW